mgnify:CR=1 FL=1
MEELKNKIKELTVKINQAIKAVKLEEKQGQLHQLKELMSAPDFWNNQSQAKQVSTQYSVLETTIANWQGLEKKISDLIEMGLKDPEISKFFILKKGVLFFKRNVFLILGEK